MNILVFAFTLSLFASCGSDTLKIAGHDFEIRNLELKDGQTGLTMADLNADGHLDLVSANESFGTLSIFHGNGKGELNHVADIQAGENPGFASVADLNQDGQVDIVVANHETDYLTILLGQDGTVFSPAENSPLRVDLGPHPHVVKAQDVDLDGFVDLIVDHRQGEGLLLIRGLGEGTFETKGTLIDTGGDPYRGFAIGDINRDSKPDFLSPNPNSIGLVMSRPDAPLASGANEIPTSSPFAVDLGDFNGDDRLDIIAASLDAQDAVEVYFQGDKNFSKSNQSVFQLADGAKQIAVGDLSGNGISDAVVTTWSSEMIVLFGQANGLMRTELLDISGNPWGIAIGDLNEDGKADFVLGDGSSSTATMYLSKQ